MVPSRAKAVFVTGMLAFFHSACSRSVEGLGTSVAGQAEEDVCAALQVQRQATMAVRDASNGQDTEEATEDAEKTRAKDADKTKAKDAEKAKAKDAEKARAKAAEKAKAKDAEKAEAKEKAMAKDLDVKSGAGPDVAVLSELNAGERAELINMIWPGSGYAGTMNGGIWQRAKLAGDTIVSILGSSGGATSAFLCLVDEAQGTDRSLTTYAQVYRDYASTFSTFGLASTTEGCFTTPPDDDSCWWYSKYKEVLQGLDASAFENVKDKLKVSMYCEQTGNVVLYNFASIDQVATALAAAGNGALSSLRVSGLGEYCYDYDVASAEGYGFPSRFNPQQLPVYYYNNGPGTSASGAVCSFGSPIALVGYWCIDDALSRGRADFDDPNSYGRSFGWGIINDFPYFAGSATWLER